MLSKHIEYVLLTDVVEANSPFFLTLRLNFRKGKKATMEKKGKKRKVKYRDISEEKRKKSWTCLSICSERPYIQISETSV